VGGEWGVLPRAGCGMGKYPDVLAEVAVKVYVHWDVLLLAGVVEKGHGGGMSRRTGGEGE